MPPHLPSPPESPRRRPPPGLPLTPRLAVHHIHRFLSDYASRHQHLLLPLDWAAYTSRRVQAALDRLPTRYDYNAATKLLTIKCMNTPVHDAVQAFVGDTKLEMVLSGFLSPAEARLLKVCQPPHDLPSYTTTPPPPHHDHPLRKPAADVKTADIEFRPFGSLLPSVLFEVGWSESYDDLVADARQWLEKSRGLTTVVVLVKFFEAALPKRHQAEEDDSAGPPPKFSIEDYLRLQSTVLASDHVGAITAFIETWRYNPTTEQAYRDGSRVSLLPPSPSSENPRLAFTDLFPTAADAQTNTL